MYFTFKNHLKHLHIYSYLLLLSTIKSHGTARKYALFISGEWSGLFTLKFFSDKNM